jgi:hypothetical protein
MDLNGIVLPDISFNKEDIFSESREDLKIFFPFEISISSTSIIHPTTQQPFFPGNLNLQKFKKRLFLLQHYNS